jgi:sRNA-binding carbon storage regulator CsrA
MKYSAKFFQVLLVGFMCVFLSGCWFLVIGGAGAVGGYAISQDTFEGISSKGQEELLTAAHKVLSVMGTITDERPKDGEIRAIVYGNHVTVDVIQINLTTSKLRVKARKDLLPSRAVAQEVYTKIMNQLEQ